MYFNFLKNKSDNKRSTSAYNLVTYYKSKVYLLYGLILYIRYD